MADLRDVNLNRLAIFVAPKLAGATGVPLAASPGPARMKDAIRLEDVEVERLEDDVLVQGRPVWPRGRRPARRG